MVSPSESQEIVARTVARSGMLPDEMSVLLHEADESSEDADVDLPLLEIEINGVDDVVVNNSDFVGFKTDGDGNHIGRVYFSEYEMELDVQIWTTPNGGYDPDELGERLRKALYPYSSYGPNKDFVTAEGEVENQITYFKLGEGDRVDDLLQSPTIRRWTQEVELWACEEFQTDEEYISNVVYPSDGDFTESDDGTISNI
jgi:hypothetical protein